MTGRRWRQHRVLDEPGAVGFREFTHLLHEAVGHGLEGDFNRKGTSAFSGRMGEKVAADCVTVVDDGTLPDRRGSLTIDDEGTHILFGAGVGFSATAWLGFDLYWERFQGVEDDAGIDVKSLRVVIKFP